MHFRNAPIHVLAAVAIGLLCALFGPGGAARAQAPAAGPIQPWGLPPLPAGVGPVEKFADVSDTPQGKFLECGSVDAQGNLSFVAIGTGWISYLTPTAVQWSATRRPSWADRDRRAPAGSTATLFDHPAPQHPPHTRRQGTQTPVHTTATSCLGPTISISTPRGTCSSPILGDRPGTEPDRPNRRRVPVFARRHAAQGDGQRLVPERIAVSPTTRCWPSAILEAAGSGKAPPERSDNGCIAEGSVAFDRSSVRRDLIPGNSGPDGMHYDVKGNLWAAVAGLGGIIQIDRRCVILGFVPIPNGDAATTNFAFGGPDNQYIYLEGATSGTFWRFKAPYPGLIGPGGVRLPAQP